MANIVQMGYFRVTNERFGEFEEDVECKTRVGWLKWRLASKVLCEWCIPTRLNGNFYRTVIRLILISLLKKTITYRVECWPIRKQRVKMSVNRDENVGIKVW